MHRWQVCLLASIPSLGRTRHPFAVSGLEGRSRRLSLCSSASPKTIRTEPRECDLLRSVGNLQDLPVCALDHPVSSRQCLGCRSPALFRRRKVSLLPIHGEQIRDDLSGYGECRSIAISFLLLSVIDHRQFVALSGSKQASPLPPAHAGYACCAASIAAYASPCRLSSVRLHIARSS
jgi:hypothetical protein